MSSEIVVLESEDDDALIVGIDHLKKLELLAFIEEIGDVPSACAQLNITATMLHQAREYDSDLDSEIELAKGRYRASLLRRLQDLALNGWRKAIVGGKGRDVIVGYDEMPSDKAMEILARMHFADEMAMVTRQRITKTDLPAQAAMTANFDNLDKKDRRDLERLIKKAIEKDEPGE